MKTEPAISIGIITAAVTSILALLIAFGIDLTSGQQVAILGVIAGVGPFVAAIFTRARVTPAGVVVAKLAGPELRTVAGPALENVPTGVPVEVVPAMSG